MKTFSPIRKLSRFLPFILSVSLSLPLSLIHSLFHALPLCSFTLRLISLTFLSSFPGKCHLPVFKVLSRVESFCILSALRILRFTRIVRSETLRIQTALAFSRIVLRMLRALDQKTKETRDPALRAVLFSVFSAPSPRTRSSLARHGGSCPGSP